MKYGLRSAPFELYGHNNKFCETTLFSGKISNLNKIFKTQKGQLLLCSSELEYLYAYLFWRKISPCMLLLSTVFLLIFGKCQNIWSNGRKFSNKMSNLAVKMQKYPACILIRAYIFIFFLGKTSPYTLIQHCTRIRNCRVCWRSI